jgi:hypothetical protein
MARPPAPPTKEILEAALQGLEAQKQKLDEQIAQVRSLIGRRVGRPPRTTESATSARATNKRAGTGSTKRVLSADARKRIAAAQKKRWANFRKTQA